MRLAWRMAAIYASILVVVALLLLVGAPAVAERAMVDALGPVLLRQARSVVALLDVQAFPGWPATYLADLAAVRLSRLYVDGEVLVVDPAGEIRWNSATLVGDLRGWQLAPEVIRGIRAPGYGVREVLANEPAVVAVAPIPTPGGHGTLGTVVVFRPLRELAGVRRQIGTWVALGAGVAVAVALAAGWAAGYRMVRRLAAIQEAAAALAAGNLSRRLEVSGRDEIAGLAAGFNHMAERIEALVEELRRSQTLRRSMLATISHELRTPVTVIRGLGEALRDGLVEAGPGAARHAGQIVAEAERLGRLIDDLFQLAQIETGQLDLRFGRFAAGPWLEERATALETLVRERGAHWAARIDPSLGGVWLEADPHRLAQVLGNLVDNAARHAGPGGHVTLTAAAVAGGVRVEVADDGPGIDPADLPRVFEPFYRGREAARSRGAGLGLSIVRALVEAHGGRVGVASAPGRGARFWFFLPRTAGPGTAGVAAAGPAE
ncbi:integral membrane sensor signal transduction histidine kinase [Thermaerobacter marianensis DSM 12885]|uniref:histidine kinase n=1 Tax=Thermaerobacter marianensis (strain ATCC 700841 / DSM 12885 / JCM 10246 / 7p75a) TaxID=644966 RepID=E6SMA9_THEM7|nr:ATP-binding protein [Thermaerobacter marianensis]ADU51468.1 integral membrane sensor signal transduction histidine kinase [Thermaerobacter marianensis DSM 12885]